MGAKAPIRSSEHTEVKSRISETSNWACCKDEGAKKTFGLKIMRYGFF